MRNSRIDAAKFILMVLVVAGHLIEWLPLDSDQVVYRWIYMFHMPAFVFLSGLVCADVLDVRRARTLVAFVVLPYLAHQMATNGMVSVLGREPFAYQVSNPYWALWYLVSLFCWRLLLPVMVATGAPVLVAVGISLLSGLAPEFNHSWSMGRTASLLPFFVLGYVFAQNGGPRLPTGRPAVAVAMLVAVGAAAYLSREVPLQWLWRTPLTKGSTSGLLGEYRCVPPSYCWGCWVPSQSSCWCPTLRRLRGWAGSRWPYSSGTSTF